MKRQEKIEALVEIRDYMRDNVELIPEHICNQFNLLARAIGVESPDNWCIFGIKRTPPKLAFNELLKKEANRG
jgi:hypothetical protein